MPRLSMLTKLSTLLYPFVDRNTVSDAILVGPAKILGDMDATLDLMYYGGRYLEPGSVTVSQATNTVTQVPPTGVAATDWTTRFQVNDEIILGGSLYGQQGRRVVATVSSGSLTVTGAPFATTETGLLYGKSTFGMWALAQDLTLYPGGYESDSALRTNVLNRWVAIMQARGTRAGLADELNRICDSTVAVLETGVPLTTLATGLTYTNSSQSVPNTGSWAAGLSAGSCVTVEGSTAGSNGRYTLYNVSVGGVTFARRAARSRFYPTLMASSGCELQFKEDRELGQLTMRVINTTGGSITAVASVTVTGATVVSARITTGGSPTVTVTSSTATTSGWVVAAGAVVEAVIQLSGLSSSTVLQPAVTSGALTAVRLGEAMLSTRLWGEGVVLTGLPPWKWGGVIAAGLRSGVNETGLTILAKTKPGWYLGLSTPGVVEEDAYTMASPDEYVVLEIDHLNRRNYTDDDLKTLVSAVLLPADVSGVLGLL